MSASGGHIPKRPLKPPFVTFSRSFRPKLYVLFSADITICIKVRRRRTHLPWGPDPLISPRRPSHCVQRLTCLRPSWDKKVGASNEMPAPTWQREKDSNPHKQSQSLSCYPYTIPLSDLAPARTVFIIAKAQKMSRGIFDFFPDVFQGPDEGTGIFCGAVGSLPITPGQQRPGRRRASAGPFGSYSAPGTWMTPMGHSFTQI